MRNLTFSEVLRYGIAAFVLCLIFREWDTVSAFLLIMASSLMPLVLGLCIAYVVSIPRDFFESHIFVNSNSPALQSLRRPLCLAITITLSVAGLILAVFMLFPALAQVTLLIRENGWQFVETVISLPILKPFEPRLHELLQSEFVQNLSKLDFAALLKEGLGGTTGTTASIGMHVFSIVGVVMTLFFGIVFSLLLLTDTHDTFGKIMRMLETYLGFDRVQKLSFVMGVADSSFRNFIARQCVEAAILCTVGVFSMLISRFPYAIGVGFLMGLSAMVPIVGYPAGLALCAFVILIISPWHAVFFVASVVVAQFAESTFVLPRIGDPRTALSPVLAMASATIGGAIAGFLGMLVAIPTGATIYQVIRADLKRRRSKDA